MGVADNKSYKNMYHFTDYPPKVNRDELQSLDVDPRINYTIKENPYKSNVNIEKDEIVLNPDLSALFKAKGKKHTGGGIDVMLKPNSFIFSDDKSLAITRNENELFEFKEGGPYKKHKMTPAEVLKRNVDLKHYNTLITNLDDPDKSNLAKRSSAMMLEKYIENIGNIAYLQEAKKGFPTGLPEFSLGTAPVYDADLKDEIMEQKQYLKYGGEVDNPYLQLGGRIGTSLANREDEIRRAARKNRSRSGLRPVTAPAVDEWGLWQGDKLPTFSNVYGVSNAADKIFDLEALSSELGYTGPKNNKAFQQWLYNSSPQNKAIIDKWHQQYGDTGPIGGMFDNKIGIRWQNAINEIRRPRDPIPTLETEPPAGDLQTLRVNRPGVPQIDNIPHPEDVTGDPQGMKTADWQFTPWQKISQLYNLGKYASAKRYMPYRSRFNPSFVDPQLVNPEQAVGDLRSVANQQLSSLNTLNPILRNAQAAETYGKLLDQMPGVRSQYDNQNAQITNQFRMANNQIGNSARLTNMQNNQQYYQQQVVGRQNYDNMKSFLSDQYMNNLLRDVESNQTLAFNLLTQPNPRYGFDFRSGKALTVNPKDIRDVYNSSQGDYLGSLLQDIDFKSLTNAEKIQYIRELQRGKALQYLNPGFGQTPPPFKKGGKVKGNPYKY